ncbi:hypothetical protein RvY_01013 [Ramazzottius varieornatus]|uniref:RUN domain-containing protein n=1 Tax=Ramazzottius varieornatus TaxID=947166 RepID=A0A1D1UFQ5_RAMVA|nr:hypothetical protein RvY_01013 [Ramazzottius varieornatus]
MTDTRTFPQREYGKQRQNLLRICGMTLKSVVDKFCFNGVLDETDTDVENLLIVLENILMHRCTKKLPSTWFSEEVPSYWPCVVQCCSKMTRSCVPAVMAMDRRLTGLTLGRIFLRIALMEKRLPEYLSELVTTESREVLHKAYHHEAFMLRDEGVSLTHMCLGLNSIDFSFCVKGEDLAHQYVPCIDFTPYLDFQPCEQAELDDEHEQAVLNGQIPRLADTASPDNSAEDSWRLKYQTLYNKYRDLAQQKNYAEEMVNLKQGRIERLEFDLAAAQGDAEATKTTHAREINKLQNIILELQSELSSARTDRPLNDRKRLETFFTGLSRNGKFHESIALESIPIDRDQFSSEVSSEDDTVSMLGDHEETPYGSTDYGPDGLLRTNSEEFTPSKSNKAGSSKDTK